MNEENTHRYKMDYNFKVIPGGLRVYWLNLSLEIILQPLLPNWEPLKHRTTSTGGHSCSFPVWGRNEYMAWALYKIPYLNILFIKRWRL